jgi:hypothetical protein
VSGGQVSDSAAEAEGYEEDADGEGAEEEGGATGAGTGKEVVEAGVAASGV